MSRQSGDKGLVRDVPQLDIGLPGAGRPGGENRSVGRKRQRRAAPAEAGDSGSLRRFPDLDSGGGIDGESGSIGRKLRAVDLRRGTPGSADQRGEVVLRIFRKDKMSASIRSGIRISLGIDCLPRKRSAPGNSKDYRSPRTERPRHDRTQRRYPARPASHGTPSLQEIPQQGGVLLISERNSPVEAPGPLKP